MKIDAIQGVQFEVSPSGSAMLSMNVTNIRDGEPVRVVMPYPELVKFVRAAEQALKVADTVYREAYSNSEEAP